MNDNTQDPFEEDPAPFGPSDVSLYVPDIDTKHTSKVILREKVVIVGDACVGKTSIAQSFHSKSLKKNKNYVMTTGGGELTIVQVPVAQTNVTIDIFLFDSPGQSMFYHGEHMKKLWRNFSFIICVFDVSSRITLRNTLHWVKSARSSMKDHEDIDALPVLLIGNKIDLRQGAHSISSRSEVGYDEGAKFASENNMIYFECSVESIGSIEAPFKYISEQSYQQYRAVLDA